MQKLSPDFIAVYEIIWKSLVDAEGHIRHNGMLKCKIVTGSAVTHNMHSEWYNGAHNEEDKFSNFVM